MKRFSNLLVLLFFIPVLLFGQQDVNLKQLDDYFSSAIEKFEIPGVAIGIVQNDSIIFAKGYGNNITPNTVFGIASMSKAFTAASIGMLVDEKKINWDDKVQKYLADFTLSDPYVSSQLNISDILSHRSGLRTFDGDLLWYGSNYSRSEVIKRIRKLSLRNQFRADYGYQNVMFITAGEVVEKVTGTTWDNFVHQRIFKKLGMNNSSTSVNEFTEGMDIAIPHVDGKPIKQINYDNSGPAASINSSVLDLLKWARMWLNNGKWNGEQILSEEVINQIFTPRVMMPVKPNNKYGINFQGYGFGWFMFDYSGYKVVHHGGGLPGVHTKIVLVPAANLGFVILTNQINGAIDAFMYKILDAFLNNKNVDYASQSYEAYQKYFTMLDDQKTKREENRVKGTSPSLPVEKYAGNFLDDYYGSAEIKFEDNNLSLTLLPTKELFTGILTHWHYNTFKIEFADAYLPYGLINFELNTNCELTGFTIDLPNPDFHFDNLHFIKK
ncbi:MAG: serine hydrolase [Ignavibacteriaceae bacterium]|nr:serine hydrolase [Ignavibacteriaceae bacterium]